MKRKEITRSTSIENFGLKLWKWINETDSNKVCNNFDKTILFALHSNISLCWIKMLKLFAVLQSSSVVFVTKKNPFFKAQLKYNDQKWKWKWQFDLLLYSLLTQYKAMVYELTIHPIFHSEYVLKWMLGKFEKNKKSKIFSLKARKRWSCWKHL